MSAVNPFASSTTTSSLLATDIVRGLDTLIDTLTSARIRKGYSPRELAEQIGFDEEDVLDFEHHDFSPPVEFVMAYGIAVAVHIQFLASDGEAWARRKRASTVEREIAKVFKPSDRDAASSLFERVLGSKTAVAHV
ncbi:hypothetical protein ACNPM8_01800 [Glutamicibacter sp. AGC46]